MTKAVWGARTRLAGALLCALLVSSCGDQTLQGTASSYLIITSLTGPKGESTVLSDVITVVGGVPSTFNDAGQATFQLTLKDTGPTTSPNVPSQNNFITLTQYHVQYVRSDGHNVQGVDVPYAFDGAVTSTISGTSSVGFTLVRHTAKEEAPLATLASGSPPLTVIAQVTFFGHDQTGRETSVSGNIEVAFSNFGD
jgi:hypothetical protein